MAIFRSLLVASLFAYRAIAGDDDWESPVYRDIYKFPLPIPIDKTPKTYVRSKYSKKKHVLIGLGLTRTLPLGRPLTTMRSKSSLSNNRYILGSKKQDWLDMMGFHQGQRSG
jgi:hypothetical protein